jgi:hypothetical protein
MSDRKWPPPLDCTSLGKEVNEAIDQVGRVLYGEMWISEVSSADWEMWNGYGMPDANPVRLPTPARGATYHAQARLRCLMTYVQVGQVYEFLYEQGIDLAGDRFDNTGFMAWFVNWRPNLRQQTSTALRIDAVRQVLRDHGKPGRGGPLTWKIFCDLVRKASGQKCTDKTIQRDVKALRK